MKEITREEWQAKFKFKDSVEAVEIADDFRMHYYDNGVVAGHNKGVDLLLVKADQVEEKKNG